MSITLPAPLVPDGPTRPRLNSLTIPILGELLLAMSVAMAGLWLASRASDTAAGAFGLTHQVLEALFVLFRVLAIGVGITITQWLGAQQVEQAKRTAVAGLAAATWAGVVVAGFVLALTPWTLAVLNAPAEVAKLALPFMPALALALVFEAHNVTMAATLRAHLRAREALVAMVAINASHLLLAIVLMLGVGDWDGFGLMGYAYAMTVSRIVGVLLHRHFWKTRLGIHPKPRDWWAVPRGLITPVLRVGVPGAMVEAVYRICFLVSLAAIAKLGVAALATHAYTVQSLKYVLLISMAIGWAVEIRVGHLVGAGDFRAAHLLVRKAIRNGLFASGTMVIIATLAAPWYMQAFTRDPAVIEATRMLLALSFLLETGRVFNMIMNGALRSTGDVLFPALSSVGSLVLVLAFGATVMGHRWGLVGVWIAYALDEWIRGGLLMWRWEVRGWFAHARSTHGRVRSPPST